jgi:hypothetical protein
MKNHRLPKIILFGQPSRAKMRADHPRLGWERHKERFKGHGNFMGGRKKRGFE